MITLYAVIKLIAAVVMIDIKLRIKVAGVNTNPISTLKLNDFPLQGRVRAIPHIGF